jgi:protein-L-isoaspartate(D-aspartate) O-methyltransferase
MISNTALIQHLIKNNSLKSDNIIQAFTHVDRADFVSGPVPPDIYGDYPLPIGLGQTISQPTTVAMMLEMLSPRPGDKILDIGSGSGWTTALLSFIVNEQGSVTGLERLSELVKFGAKNLKKYSFKNAKIIQASNRPGLPGEKFDRILVSAAANELPSELLEQLKQNGKLVIPVKNSIYEITIKSDRTLEKVEHYGFSFVPLII